jgi:hypothetical protein
MIVAHQAGVALFLAILVGYALQLRRAARWRAAVEVAPVVDALARDD